MQSSTTARAGRSAAAGRLGPANSDSAASARRRSTVARLVRGAARLIRGLARLLASRRQRRRARLQGWATMDPRLLADIGVTRADVQAVLYAGVPIERLRVRPLSRSGEVVAQASRPPRLRLVAADDLDEAA